MILRKFTKNITDQNWFAVGLDVLVVITGIFLGLQVTEWNEERSRQTQVKQYLLALKADLRADKEMLEIITYQIDDSRVRFQVMIDEVARKNISELSNIDLFYSTFEPLYRPYAWNRTTFNQLRASGAVRQINNPKIREIISNYEARSQHLDLDFETDFILTQRVDELAQALINYNYPNLIELLGRWQRAENGDLIDFKNSDLYKKTKNNDLVILSKNMSQIYELSNAMINLSRNYAPRTEYEIPELIKMGEDIISLINAEYGISD